MKTFAFAAAALLAAPAAAQEREPPKLPLPAVALDFVRADGQRAAVPGTLVERTLKTATWRGVRIDFGFDASQFENPRVNTNDTSALAAKAGRSVQARALLTFSW